MDDKISVGIIVLLMAILAIVLLSGNVYINETRFNVSSGGPIPISEFVKEIKTEKWYEGYDNETVKWLESLGDKYVWYSSEGYVIMDKVDSSKIPSVYAADVDYWEIFSAKELERHSLGNVENPTEVVLVKNVRYISEDAHYYDV